MKRVFILSLMTLFLVIASFGQAAEKPTSTATTSTAATSDKPKKPPIFRPTKDQIKQVQAMLKEKKLYNGEANGAYNDETRTGIKSFQKDNGLKETGTLNRATLEKFGVELTDKQKLIPVSQNSFATPATGASTTKPAKTTTPAATKDSTVVMSSGDVPSTASSESAPKRPAPFRANEDQIKAAQKLLKAGKMYAGEETGKFDDAFREGLGKYQEANGLKVTKTLNAGTLEKMGITLTDAQKANVAAHAAYDAAKAPKN